MSSRDRLRRALLKGQIPTEAKYEDVKALLEEAGWRMARSSGSHFMFVKADRRTEPVTVHGGKVKIETLKMLAVELKNAEGV